MKEYKQCLFFSYQRYCRRRYIKDLIYLYYSDLSCYKCPKLKCKHFKKNNIYNRLILKILCVFPYLNKYIRFL